MATASAARRSQTIGVVLVLVWVVLTASKDVYLGHLVQDLDSTLLLVGCIAIAVVFFNAIQLVERAAYARVFAANLVDVFWLNLFTAAGWASFFAALKFLEAAVAESFVVAVDPLATLVLARALRQQSPVLPSELAASWAMLGAAAFLGVGVWYGHSSVGVLGAADATFGIVCVLVCGIANGGITVMSKRLADRKVTASQVMASRFFLLLAGCLALVLIRGQDLGALADHAGAVAVVAVLGVIVPMFVLQKAIERAEPMTVVLVGSIVPVVAFAFQQLDSRLTFSWLSCGGVTAIFVIVIGGTCRRIGTGEAA
jgi:drug/metabolite transporter (DMT)-like permease